MTETTVQLAVSPRDFGRGLKVVRSDLQGRYDAASQTWTVRADRWMAYVDRTHYRPLTRVDAACGQYDAANGCPLHGELCAPEYR